MILINRFSKETVVNVEGSQIESSELVAAADEAAQKQPGKYKTLTPMSQMEVGCPGARGAGSPPTQTQVGRTPHKPSLPATQPRAPPAKPKDLRDDSPEQWGLVAKERQPPRDQT